MDIRHITSLTRAERREAAQRAAELGHHLHEANPHPPGTTKHQEFQDDYVAHRFAPEPERA